MSRKGVIAKRVKTAPDGSIENQRPTAQSGWPRNECSALGQISVRLKSRPKSKPADHATRPGKHCPAVGQATTVTPRRARPCARAGKQASRPRNPRVPRPMHPSEPGRTSHVRPRNHRPNLLRRPRRPTVKSSGHDRSDSAKTRLSGRRPDRPSERRGRPEAVFEAQSAQFKPKAGADLARLGLAAFILRAL
ncbi:unnamed protein product [Microthlaspi erraticum]|uniref:Uncharacterized protein n=1 Tax=Microthlaspi erraticum TaxID=1685480 RepID=A0A6D2HH95_9BRAS|nr:unnamed protein product [Microthlaspi erraticum]